MGSENEILSRIVAELSAKSGRGEELSSSLRRLRDEIKKMTENGETVFGKLRALLESFREIIPDEKQRYNAAIKALSATSKLGPQEIVKVVNDQLGELRLLEKGLLSSLPVRRDEIQAMEGRARELKDDIAKLRETLSRLENEEKELRGNIAAREKDAGAVEKEVAIIFTDIGADIAGIKKKVEEFSEAAAVRPPHPVQPAQPAQPAQTAQPVPAAAASKGDISPDLAKKGGDQKTERTEIAEASVTASPEAWQRPKNCPMCGGRMNFQSSQRLWMCFACAYQEAVTGGESRPREEHPAGLSGPTGTLTGLSSPQVQDSAWQKKCPMCGGVMNFHSNDQLWICYSCAYEETKDGKAHGAGERTGERTQAPEPAPAAVPISELFPSPAPSAPSYGSDPIKGSIKDSSSSKSHAPSKKKTCPNCRRKMNWHENEKAWRCPHCEYERKI